MQSYASSITRICCPTHEFILNLRSHGQERRFPERQTYRVQYMTDVGPVFFYRVPSASQLIATPIYLPFFLSVTVSQVSQSALHHPSMGKHRLGHFDRYGWANFPISPEFCHHKWTLVKCECTTSVSRSQGLFSHDMTCKTVTELGHVQRSNPKTSKTMKMKTRYCLIADDRHHIIHTLYNVSFKSTGSHCGKYVSKQYILWSVTVKMNAAYLSKRHMPHIFPTAKQD